MCGIAGLYGGGDIRAATARLAHRGPDQEGYHCDGPMQLGVRRLVVIDRDGGRQPMSDARGDRWIVYNGELFNYIELRHELEGKGHQFRTRSDTEVVLAAYVEWGRACLQRFLGMFAFAVWDRRLLFLARDRFGEKPLFYARRGRRFMFASEIKALLLEMPAEPNVDARFSVLEAAQEPETLFKNIYSLPPAHWLTFDGTEMAITRYWNLPAEGRDERPEDELGEELESLITDAVRLRLRADLPIGLFLSGGLDSSLIGAIARPAKVFTCHLPYGEAFDEFAHAETMARAIGAEHVAVPLTAADFQAILPRVIWHLDQPVGTASAAAEFALARAARDHVTVVLGGQGADEAFGGYVRHALLAAERHLADAPLLRDYHPLARVLWGARMFTDPADRYVQLIHRGDGDATELHATARALFSRHRDSIVDQMGAVDFATTFPSLILMNDRAAAAYGLENRTPFLDHRIVEFAFRLPATLKIRNLTTKVLLRRAARRILPEAIVDRHDKKGLAVPVAHWLRGELKHWASELADALSRRGIDIHPLADRGQFDRTLFAKVSLELWFRTFIDRPGDAPLS